MADYFTPTVIQPSIPAADISPLERLVLEAIFQSEADGDRIYFFSETAPELFLEIPADNLDVALAQSAGIPSRLAGDLGERSRTLDPQAAYLELDLSVTGWEFIFQDIVRRSRTLKYVTAVSALTCSRMRPDAFGGMATLITSSRINAKSTADLLDDWIGGIEDSPPSGTSA